MGLVQLVGGSSQVTDEFDLRFYHFALTDARIEFLRGFPRLGRIHGSAAQGFRTILDSFPERQRWPLLKALVRRAHERAVTLSGEKVPRSDQDLLRRYGLGYAGVSSRISETYHIDQVSAGPACRFDKKALAALIMERLVPICGEMSGRFSKYHWWHSIRSHSWQIDTEIEIRDSSYQLRYHHDIAPSNGEAMRLKGNISFLLWLGIFPTEWNLIKRGDEENVAASLSGLCSDFISVAPELLVGLNP